MIPIKLLSGGFILIGFLLVLLALKYKKPEWSGLPSFSLAQWKKAGLWGNNLYLPQGRKINTAGWLLFTAGLLLQFLSR